MVEMIEFNISVIPDSGSCVDTVTNVSSIVELLQQSSDPFEARALLLEINELLHDAINKTKIG